MFCLIIFVYLFYPSFLYYISYCLINKDITSNFHLIGRYVLHYTVLIIPKISFVNSNLENYKRTFKNSKENHMQL